MESITHWIVHYGYFGLFSLLVLGIVGLPVPDETLLTFAGYLVFKHKLHFPLTLASAFLGSICGITISFLLGKSLGFYLLHKYGPYFLITPDKLTKVHDWFCRTGRWSLAIGYFIPGVRHLTAYVAGATKLEYPIFARYAYLGGIVWSGSFIVLGYALGNHWEKVSARIQDQILIACAILVVLGAAVWVIKKKVLDL